MTAPPVRIFISYAREDLALKDALVAHLSFLERAERATVWHDSMVDPGEERHPRIDRELGTAQIVLLLVSPDFIVSDFIHEHQLADALRRHEAGTARVIPVILRRCHFDGLPFSRLQPLPRFARPVTSYDDRDVGMAEVAAAVERVVSDVEDEALEASSAAGDEAASDDSTRVYFLAHPDDAEYCARIRDKIHPAVLTSPLGVDLTDHWDLPPGTVTSEQIRRADIAVLVISGRMLHSPRVADAYDQVVEMYERHVVRIVIAQARRLMLDSLPFQDVPVFPSSGVALIDLDEGAKDEAVFRIAHALTVAIYNHRMAKDGLLVPTRRYRPETTPETAPSTVGPSPAPRSEPEPFDFLAGELGSR